MQIVKNTTILFDPFGSARIIGLLLLVQAHKKGGDKLMTPP